MPHSYQLVARIEAGEVSEHYRGLQDGAREVALKLFSPRFSDPDYGRAVVEVSRKVAALGHPSVLHDEDVGMVDGRVCCVRAHHDGYHLGIALSRLATKEVVLPVPVALQIGVEVMLALGAAHAAGIVHGALTPANILIGRDGRARVTDFGALWAMRESELLRPLAERGRRTYRAPELSKGTEADAGCDVYSVGAILYELLTLREVGASRAGGVSTRRDELMPPSRLDRRINARLDPLILRALDPLKSRRHKNGSEMAEAFTGHLGATFSTPGPTEIARFVRELFPNEVNLAGSTSDLPRTGTFTLDAVTAGGSLPGMRIEVAERPSYTSSTLEAVEMPAQRLDDKTTSDPMPARAVSAWDAPPGVLDPAVARHLSEPARQPIEVQDTGPLPRVDADRPQRPKVVLVGTDTRTDVTTNPAAAQEILSGTVDGSPTVEARKPRVAPSRPPRRDGPLPAPGRPERPDWHVKYQAPRPAPPVKTPTSSWLIAVVMALVAAGLTFIAVSHRTHGPVSWDSPPHGPPPPRSTPPPPIAHHEPQAHRDTPPPPRPATYCLTLATDVPGAFVTIDGQAPRSLPLSGLPVGPGDHQVVVTATGHPAQRFTMGEGFTRAPCVARVIPLANVR
jgi:serine/threonine protein kinase